MTEPNSELLARVDERTKNIVDKLETLTKAIDECVRPNIQSNSLDIAVLKSHERVVIGILVIIVPVVAVILWDLVR